VEHLRVVDGLARVSDFLERVGRILDEVAELEGAPRDSEPYDAREDCEEVVRMFIDPQAPCRVAQMSSAAREEAAQRLKAGGQGSCEKGDLEAPLVEPSKVFERPLKDVLTYLDHHARLIQEFKSTRQFQMVVGLYGA
jgi:hypothetical protein